MIKDAKIVNNKNKIATPEIALLTSEPWDQWILEQEPEALPAPTNNYFENSNEFCRQNSTNSLTSLVSQSDSEDSGIGSNLNSPILPILTLLINMR